MSQKSAKMARALFLLLLLQQSDSFSLLQRTSSVHTVLRASDDAIDACALWSITRMDFKRILMKKSQQKLDTSHGSRELD